MKPAELKTVFDKVPFGIQGRPMRPTADMAALSKAYRTSELVYACIGVKARAAVDPRLIVERRSSKGNWDEVDGHPFRRLIMRPNAYMDEASFAQAVITSCDVFGVFYAEIVRKGKTPIALYPLDPAKVQPIPSDTGEIASYLWKDGNLSVVVPAEDMLVWRGYDPQNRYHGISPLSVAMGSVNADNMQTDYIASFFSTGGVPSGILTIKNRSIDAAEGDMVRQMWRQKFNPRYGGLKEDIAVLDENAEFQVLGSRLDQLQSDEIRSVTEARICMVFNVPPLIVYAYVGLMRATYSNLQEAWAQFWSSYLTPWFTQYRNWLTWSLLSEFESKDLIFGERVRLSHDTSKVAALREDVDAAQRRARENLLAGGMTLNEFREAVGLAPDPTGNVYLRANSISVIPFEAKEVLPGEKEPRTNGDDSQLGLKRIVPPVAWAQKALEDRERIAERNVNRIEAYLMGEYRKAADAARGHKSTDASGAETKTDQSLEEYVIGVLDTGDVLEGVTMPLFRAAIRRGYVHGGAMLNMSIAFDLENQRVQDALDSLLKLIKRDVPDTTIEQIRGLIGKMVRDGWSVDQLAAKIMEVGLINSPLRAEMIAHTESARAYTQGAILVYKDSGVVEEVEWDSFLDDRTTEICRGLNGKRAKLGEEFPGGFTGPPAHIRCRSALIPIVR